MSGCGAFKFAGSAIDPVYRHRNQTPAPSLGSRSQCALEHQAALGEPANMPAIGPHCGGGRYKFVRAKLEPLPRFTGALQGLQTAARRYGWRRYRDDHTWLGFEALMIPAVDHHLGLGAVDPTRSRRILKSRISSPT